jgi:cell division protein FtsZ
MLNEMMKFDLPKETSSIIKVIGVGGGGSNAVNHMYKLGIKGVDFIVCNTDQQALDISPVPIKVALGASLTEGRGAGSIPEVGKNAAIENIEEIRSILSNNTKMVFITAGMGGGTGTGAAPVIAKIAKEMGILTVAIITIPFAFEGKKRRAQAEAGLEELKASVDTLLIISNDKLREIYGNLKLTDAFGHADNVLTTAAKSIAEIITVTLHINTDFADIQTVMKDSGVAIMGNATANGENRAIKAVEQALCSPLLNDSDIRGARYVLLNITCGPEDEITMDELGDITDYIQEAAGMSAEVIKGFGIDPELGDKVNVTIIATGFNSKVDLGVQTSRETKKIVHNLTTEAPAPVVNVTPVATTQPAEEVVSSKPEVNEPVMKTVVEEQATIEFEIVKKELPKYEAPVSEPVKAEVKEEAEPKMEGEISAEEQQKKANERISRIRQFNFKSRTPGGLAELENEPAYKRRNVTLNSVPHSSESQVSKYTLSEGEDNKTEIKPNNSFLHDNVD